MIKHVPLHVLLLVLLLLLVPGLAAGDTADLDSALQDLTDQISSGMKTESRRVIAVAEFSNLDGRITELGQFISEELVTRLFQAGRYRVIERQLLNDVLKEHELTISGLVDEDSARELGRILGVEAICSGTITDLGETVKLNARLISTETATLFAVAAAELPKDDVVQRLMGGASRRRTPPGTGAGIVFSEDFAGVKEGLIPDGWIGGAHLAVRPGSTKKGAYVLTPFENGPHRFTIPDIPFPDDWKLTVEFSIEHREAHGRHGFYAPQVWRIGDLAIDLAEKSIKINNTRIDRRIATRQIHLLEVVKEGPVFTLSLDAEKLSTIRIDGFEPPTGISVYDTHGFEIHRVEVAGGI